jgi:hypothetical protein
MRCLPVRGKPGAVLGFQTTPGATPSYSWKTQGSKHNPSRPKPSAAQTPAPSPPPSTLGPHLVFLEDPGHGACPSTLGPFPASKTMHPR